MLADEIKAAVAGAREAVYEAYHWKENARRAGVQEGHFRAALEYYAGLCHLQGQWYAHLGPAEQCTHADVTRLELSKLVQNGPAAFEVAL